MWKHTKKKLNSNIKVEKDTVTDAVYVYRQGKMRTLVFDSLEFSGPVNLDPQDVPDTNVPFPVILSSSGTNNNYYMVILKSSASIHLFRGSDGSSVGSTTHGEKLVGSVTYYVT